MSNKTNYNYKSFDIPYNDHLERTDTIPSSGISGTYGDDKIQNPGEIGENVLDGQSIDNLEIKSWIKSANYRPKSHGFIIDGKMGYIECMQLYVGNGGIVGGSLDIPDYTTTNSFHVDTAGNMWIGRNTAGPITSAPAYILNTGAAAFTNVTIHGRYGKALADAIDSDANLITDVINDRLNTQAEEILGDYTFGGVGSLRINTDANNGIWLSPTGILGKKAGNPTFTITTSGDATFYGELSAAYGTFGTITAGTLKGSLIIGDGITTAVTIGGAVNAVGQFIKDVVNGKLNTESEQILADFDFGAVDYAGAVKAGSITWNTSTGAITGGSGVAIYRGGIVGASAGTPTFTINATTGAAYFAGAIGSGTSISAPTITGGSISGALITGGTVRAGTYTSSYMELGDVSGQPYLRGFISAARRVQLDNDSLEMWNASSYKTLGVYDAQFNIYLGNSTEKLLGSFRAEAGGVDLFGSFGNYLTIKGSHNSVGTSWPILFSSYNDDTTAIESVAFMGYSSGLSHFSMLGSSQRITSNRFTADTHINFGLSTSGDSGYGIRQSGGTMQYKDSGDPSWTAFSSVGGEVNTASSAGGTYGLYYTKVGVDLRFRGLAAGTGISITNNGTYLTLTNTGAGLPTGVTLEHIYYTGFSWASTSTIYVGGLSGGNLSYSSGRIVSNKDLVANPGSLHASGNLYTGGVSGSSGSLNAAEWNIGTSSFINWNAGNANVYIDDDIYVNGKLKQLDTSIVLNGVTYSRKLMSTVVTGGTGYILHSSV